MTRPYSAPENAAYAYVGAFIDELARAGVRHVVLCPGSRSTPLAISAARHPAINVWTLIDERSAAFFAFGLARAERAPAAVLSTSGTAAANFLPAVVEARYSRVPLVVLTADRPHELRESGAPQTIDQIRLYGTHAKWFVDLALPEATNAALRYVRAVAGQAAAVARDEPAGPVHLNFPTREPLVPVLSPEEFPPPAEREEQAWDGRARGQPYAAAHQGRRVPSSDLIACLASELLRCDNGVIVCGPSDDPALPAAVARVAGMLAYPVLADPLSQVRCGRHDRRCVIDCYDPMLRVGALAGRLAPDVILRFGGVPASKPLAQYLTMHDRARQIVIDAGGGWQDPTRLAGEFLHADPVMLCEALADALAAGAATRADASRASEWLNTWLRLAKRTQETLQAHLDGIDEPFEGRVFAELGEAVPDGTVLYVGNSMPVRDLDSFFPGSPKAIRMIGNRGASGIDGLTSSALGMAASGAGPVVLVLGDLAFYHDMNGLLAARLHRLRATIVLINNDGGGIFSFLPQAAFPEHFEGLFGTPHGLEFRHAAALYDAAYVRAESWSAFRAAVGGGIKADRLTIVEVRTARDRNVVLHRQAWQVVENALAVDLPVAQGTG